MEVNNLLKKLNRIEAQIEKVRGCSPLTHGWQTQRYAKASRKWDELSKEKHNTIKQINEIGYDRCGQCGRWHNETEYDGFCCVACSHGY